MPVVKVWGLPGMVNREDLRQEIKKLVLGIPQMGLNDPRTVTVRYPEETCSESGDVGVEVRMSKKDERTLDVRRAVLLGIQALVEEYCPQGTFVETYPDEPVPKEEYFSNRHKL